MPTSDVGRVAARCLSLSLWLSGGSLAALWLSAALDGLSADRDRSPLGEAGMGERVEEHVEAA
jgi:hypothetical protein